MTWTENPIYAFDTETTGPDPDTARIVTADLIMLDPAGQSAQTESFLADPGVEIPAEATEVHGITTEYARAYGRPAAEVTLAVQQKLHDAWQRGIPVVAFNASYDLTVLDRELRRHHGTELTITGPVLDPYVLDRALDRFRKGKRKLGLVCAHYGIALDNAHNSAADAEAAGRLMYALASKYPNEIGQVLLRDLWVMQRAGHRAWAANFQAYLAEQGKTEVVDGSWPLRTWHEPVEVSE